jgi:tetratricopeptide (TPR) repeat protein
MSFVAGLSNQEHDTFEGRTNNPFIPRAFQESQNRAFKIQQDRGLAATKPSTASSIPDSTYKSATLIRRDKDAKSTTGELVLSCKGIAFYPSAINAQQNDDIKVAWKNLAKHQVTKATSHRLLLKLVHKRQDKACYFQFKDQDDLLAIKADIRSRVTAYRQNTLGLSARISDQKLHTLGVSVYHLSHVFLKKEVCTSRDAKGNLLSRCSKIYDIENLQDPLGAIRKKGRNVICPLDEMSGAAYVHCLQGKDHVGEATHMLIYTWQYTIGDIIDTLRDFCQTHELDPKRIYIWICCLCVNQHRAKVDSESPTDFLAMLGERIKRIKHVLVMMAPWKAPAILTRIWCIFELFIANTNGCMFDIIMPPDEKDSMEQDINTQGGGIDGLYEMLGNIKVQNAQASYEKDRLGILETIGSNVGHQVLNNQVNRLLRGLMQHVLVRLVEEKENTNDVSYARFCREVGLILNAHGGFDAALKIYRTAMSIFENVLGDHPNTADMYHNIGHVLDNKGDYDGAMFMYQKALAINESVLGDHPSTACTYNNIGSVLNKKGDYDGAIGMYHKALAIKEAVLGDHPSTATTYNNIGNVLNEKGDYDGAFAMYRKASTIIEAVHGDQQKTASAYNSSGLALYKKGDYDGAMALYQKALTIQEAVLGDHPSTAATYCNIGGVLLYNKKDYDGAMSMFQKALAIQEAVLGEHPDTANTYINIGIVLYRKGDDDGALVEFYKCLAIQDAALGPEHPNTRNCLKWIEKIQRKLKRNHDRPTVHGRA